MLRGRIAAAALIAFIAVACKQEAAQLAATSGVFGAVAISTAPIIIGEVGSMTGNEATFGVSSDKGIQFLVKEVNDAGGIKGRKIDVKLVDDERKPEMAAIAIIWLIIPEKATAILREVASSRSKFMAPKAQAAK